MATVLRFTLSYQENNGNSSTWGTFDIMATTSISFGKKIGLQRLPACKASCLYGLMENALLKAMI
jgi:hypothetical protein